MQTVLLAVIVVIPLQQSLQADPSLINLSNNAGLSLAPDIALSGKAVYIAWHDSTPTNDDIFFTASFDNGASFGSIINVSSNTGSSTDADVAASDGNVYVVWKDNALGNEEILLSMSNDRGASFGPPINLSNTAALSLQPQIVAAGDNVYVVWSDFQAYGAGDIFFTRSIDGGASFEDIMNLSFNVGASEEPRIAVFGNNVYVVWQDYSPGNSEVLFARSTDGGRSFGSLVNLSNTPVGSIGPDIAASGTNVYVIWSDFTAGNFEIFLRRSSDNGASFGNAVNLSMDARTSSNGAISTSNSDVYVVWRDETSGNPEILFRMSNDGGATFGSAINLSKNTGESVSPVIASSGTNVFVAWSDNTLGNPEILLKASTDKAAGFAELERETPAPALIAEEPKVEAAKVSVAIKQTKKVTLLAVKNSDDEPIFGVKIKLGEGKIKFVKSRGWDREKIDPSTVIVSTTDKPLFPNKSLIIILLSDNPNALHEWSAYGENNEEIASGSVAPS